MALPNPRTDAEIGNLDLICLGLFPGFRTSAFFGSLRIGLSLRPSEIARKMASIFTQRKTKVTKARRGLNRCVPSSWFYLRCLRFLLLKRIQPLVLAAQVRIFAI